MKWQQLIGLKTVFFNVVRLFFGKILHCIREFSRFYKMVRVSRDWVETALNFVLPLSTRVKFRKPVIPGDQLVITCELLSIKRRRFGKVKGEAHVDGKLVCAGELMFSLVD